MKLTREFLPADRYVYDFGICSIKNGFAQIDTSQDASYFGTWANPEKLIIVNYCEGDITIQETDDPKEFTLHLFKLKKWNEEMGYSFYGIDPGFNEALKTKLQELGLSDLLH